jgi:hypothetical protein
MDTEYFFADGTPYKGPTCDLPDGRVVSGKTYTTESRRVHTRDSLPENVVPTVINAVPSATRAGTRKKKV